LITSSNIRLVSHAAAGNVPISTPSGDRRAVDDESKAGAG